MLASTTCGPADEPDPVGGPRTDVERQSLGPIRLDDSGRSGPIPFELPLATQSFSVTVRGAPEVLYILRRLQGPTDLLVADEADALTDIERALLGPYAAQFVSPNRVVPDRGTATALFPNNGTAAVTGGPHVLEIAAAVGLGPDAAPWSGSVEAEVVYRPSTVRRGRIDVGLHFTGAAGLTRGNAAESPLVQGALDELADRFAQADLQVGTVRYYAADPTLRTLTLDPDGAVPGLDALAASTASAAPGLHVFIVARIEGPDGTLLAGLSGGVPGAPLAPGASSSAVAVALAAVDDDPIRLGRLIAHEGGHWLGLFHTFERVGFDDQLADTPPGDASADNLMYPTAEGALLSNEQGAVMLRHGEVVAL